jgi:hypothetical protein
MNAPSAPEQLSEEWRQQMTQHQADGRRELLVEECIENFAPSHDDIAKLAYALWEQRGGGDGLSEQDWFEAEQQMRRLRAKGQAA